MAETSEEYDDRIRAIGNWIDAPFLEQIISNKLGEPVTVESFTVKAAVPAGENYMSVLHRVTVLYMTADDTDPTTLHLIFKSALASGAAAPINDEKGGVFKKEKYVYAKLIPKMKSIHDEFFSSEKPFFAAEGYETSKDGTLILEDLHHKGYTMIPRLNQLDYEHATEVIRTMARFHAISLRIYHEEPVIIETASSFLFTEENKPFVKNLMGKGPVRMAQEMEGWEEYGEDLSIIIQKLRQTERGAWQRMQIIEQKQEGFRVLNHGDLWSNNMLFSYNEDGSLNAVALIDFQIARFTSPIMDLHYFFWTAIQANVVTQHYMDFLQIYHRALMEDLATLQVPDRYPFMQLIEDFRDKALFILINISTILTVVLAPKDGVDLADFDRMFKVIMNTECYQNAVGRILTKLEEEGLLDDAISRPALEEEIEEEEEDGEDEEQNEEANMRLMSAHDRHVFSRLKSAVRGAFRRVMDI